MRALSVLLTAATVLTSVLSCSPGTQDAAQTGGAAQEGSPGAAAETARGDAGLAGAVSEEEFKAMHQIRADQAPPARGSMVDLAGGRAYLSIPSGATPPMPAVIVIHEWWGLNDHVKHWSDRLAADGYAALAVDLFGGKVATTPDSASAFTKAVVETDALRMLAAADSFLASDPRTRAERRGSIGWCFGGGWSLQAALHEKDLDACVIYYGRLVTSAEDLRGLRTPILGHFANQDGSITPEMVDRFEKALSEAGVPHRIYRYEAEHAFANPSGARYNEAAAAEAWERTRAFLAERLKQRADGGGADTGTGAGN